MTGQATKPTTKATTSRTTFHRQHSAGERQLAAILLAFFSDQAGRIVKALKDYDSITPSIIPQVFRPADEHELFMAAIEDQVVKMMATGAGAEVANISARAPAESKAANLQPFDLPQSVKDAITAAFDDLNEQEYWRAIQATTEQQLTSIIQQGIDEGLNGFYMRKRIQQALGELSKVRAAAIARTETTAAFNSGHQAAYDGLAADGLVTGKTWLAAPDKDTRETHAALDGVTVGPSEDFDVGGSPAPYPGHWSLPAEERVNCRCTTVAAFPDEDTA